MGEGSFDFLKRFQAIHRPGRRDPGRRAHGGEVEIRSGWVIRIGDSASPAVRQAAEDLADYLQISMDIHVASGDAAAGCGTIRFEEAASGD